MSALDRSVLGTLSAVAPVLDRVGERLPAPARIYVGENEVSVLPWLAGAPITALLAWTEQLTDVTYYVSKIGDSAEVKAIGQLDKTFTAEIIAYTNRRFDVQASITGQRPTTTEAALRRVADVEHPVDLTPAGGDS